MNIDMKQLRENIHSVVANLQALGEVEDGRKELAKLQREFEVWQHNVKLMKGEFEEVKGQCDAMVKLAHEKLAEANRLDQEIKAKTDELAKVKQEMGQIRLRFFGG
jgi:chromosome segregation ATPase